ncbi:hypothetical protein PACTADRAFT_47442 [Pachysolen tannophilus NRRL Y-2460]|uniref:Lethal giant larvae (Lgl)-like C-terminal domain-containing protein n=1 Tax=Pachysolen tannophilus NRRL Y-2460 TaxID=669874 RepID=A0A1E4U0M3_PACTA|nr:hypothetical protein PACTADRAFT_47442 [Pachysolen tannophilus NRRL Y-2460]
MSKMFKNKPNLKNVTNVTNSLKTVRERDLSTGLSMRNFKLDDLTRYGIAGSIMGMAYEPVQSLMALSTDKGHIHVYGQQRVEVVFELKTTLPIITLKFIKGIYLVAIDTKNTILIFSLSSKKLLASYTAPGMISSIESDYSLDYLLIGLVSGVIVIYDVDRCALAPFKIDNLQKIIIPEERTATPVLSIKWHPRDFGTLLITYNYCCAVYSFTTGEIKTSFRYELPPGAPGGDNLPKDDIDLYRYPPMVNALWHPNGLNVVTIHEDNSIVFWDANDGTLLQARTLFDTDVNIPSTYPIHNNGNSKDDNKFLTPIIKASWICEENPEYTSLLICGGDSNEEEGIHTFTMLDFGVTPKYSITSYEKMSRFYAAPKQHKVIPIHATANIIDFLPLGQSSPYFNGNHNPSFILVLLDDGDLKFMNYPTGNINFKSEIFPPSISWINPKITCSTATPVPRAQWLGMLNSKEKGKVPTLLKGGLPTKRPPRSHDLRSALITGHQNGYIRMRDASLGELDDSSVLEIDLSSVLGSNSSNMDITQVSFAAETAELLCSLANGDALLFKFGLNKNYNPRMSDLNKRLQDLSIGNSRNSEGILINIADRVPYYIREGFLPVSLIRANQKSITAIKNSNVGFVCVGYETGEIIVIDRRGPAIIFQDNLSNIMSKKKSSFYKATSIEFLIAEINEDGYSSIVMTIGTNIGDLMFFKILPYGNGRFTVNFVDALDGVNSDSIKEIIGLDPISGNPTTARMQDMQKLSTGVIIQSLIITRSSKDMRVIKSNKTKLSYKVFNSVVGTGGISMIYNEQKKYSTVYSVVTNSNEIKVLSIPSLAEFNTLVLPYSINPQYSYQSVVLPSGDVVVRIDQTEAGLVNIAGKGLKQSSFDSDILFNDQMVIPQRPTINTLQYFRGTKLITYDDFITLISGPNRPLTKNPESRLSYNLSPYNPVNMPSLTGSSPRTPTLGGGFFSKGKGKDNDDDDEFKYDKPVRKYNSNILHSPVTVKHVMRSITNGIESIDEGGNDYASEFKDNMNQSMTDTRNSVLSSVFKAKFGF